MRFRIFDKQEKKYISEFLSQYYLNHEGKLFFIYAGEGKHNEIHKELDPDRYVVEMSTGKPDKNGNKIYAGDKLSYQGNTGIVVWSKAGCNYCVVKPNTNILTEWGLWWKDSDEFEIIGTIHNVKQL